jgi:hypothetical protein
MGEVDRDRFVPPEGGAYHVAACAVGPCDKALFDAVPAFVGDGSSTFHLPSVGGASAAPGIDHGSWWVGVDGDLSGTAAAQCKNSQSDE